MTIQTINLGTYPNDGTGDDLRTAFTKVNSNFELLNQEINIANAVNVGTGVGVFKQKSSTNLEFLSLISTDQSVTITPNLPAGTINLRSTAKVESDTQPVLGADLDLNGFKVVDSSLTRTSDVQTTVWGIDVTVLNSIVELMIISNAIKIDFGAFNNDTSTSYPDIDMGSFTGAFQPLVNNNLDFGYFG
jgi:hypothetical protein